jgi:hypothetical protein
VFPVRFELNSYILFRTLSVCRIIMEQQMWHLLSRINSSSRRRGDPISKLINGLATNKNLVMGPVGPETTNYCAGEG